MAKILSNAGIVTGLPVEAEHVSQSVNALTGVDAYDITISGSLVVNGLTYPYVDGPADLPILTDGNGNLTIRVLDTVPTASYVTSSNVDGPHGFDSVISASYAISASQAIFAVLASSSLFAINAQQAENANTAISSSHTITASYALNGEDGKYAISSSHALTASYVTGNVTSPYKQNISGSVVNINHKFNSRDILVGVYQTSGSEAPTSIIPSSVVLTDSNNVLLTFSNVVIGYAIITDGKGIANSLSNYSASYAETASYAISSSHEVTHEVSSSHSQTSISSSYALTASYALNSDGGDPFPYTGSAVISGSLEVIGNVSFGYGAVTSPSAWSTGGALSTARQLPGGTGTQNAGLAFGGGNAAWSSFSCTEEYDGTSWTAGGALATPRSGLVGAGTQTAGLAFAGGTSTEEYDGASWSVGGTMADGAYNRAGTGTQTAAIAFGGQLAFDCTCTEEYDGISWTAGGALSTARHALAGAGTQNAGLAMGGAYMNGTRLTCTEEYDGTSWTSGGAMITVQLRGGAGAGTQNAALAFGGNGFACTEEYDGTSWSVGGALILGRTYLEGAGTQTAGLAFGGAIGSGVLTCTEEYTGGVIGGFETTFDYSGITGETTATGSFKGTLDGNATTSTSASYAITASHALNGGNSVTSSYAVTASYITSSNVDGPYGFDSILTSSYALTASYALNGSGNSITASYAVTASYITSSNVDGPYGFDSILSSSYALTASYLDGLVESASFALTASYVEMADAYREDFTNVNSITVSHNIGSTDVLVAVYETTGGTSPQLIIPLSVTLTNDFTAVIVFATNIDGYVIITDGKGVANVGLVTSASYALTSSYAVTASHVVGLDKTSYREAVTGTTAYTVTHGLNELYPLVQAYEQVTLAQEIPSGIVSTGVNSILVSFQNVFDGTIVVKK